MLKNVMIILLIGILITRCLYVLFKLLDAPFDVDCIYVLLALGIEEVHMWHDVVKKFQKELKILMFQQHGHASCLSHGFGVKVTRVAYVLKTLNEILSVLKHSVDGSAVKVPSDIAGCWQSMGHHFIKNSCTLG